MTRILAIDFGEKRIGLATGDTAGGLATPRRTIARSADDAAVAAIGRFCREEQIDTLLVGIPRSPEGRESAIAPRIRSFSEKLARAVSLPLQFHEETLTSDEAARRLRGRRSRAGIDAEAAAVLLEDWLAHRGQESA
ncbi:MAG TPA: Holliday junction resolvase RuvX [Thermoanaerobaculia bacterium]|nr:Holliday junction resolvase RuvX [Thermoanaerobaculia bacterium]